MLPLTNISDVNLVVCVAAAISVMRSHVHTAHKLLRREIAAAYLQPTEDGRSGMQHELPSDELGSLIHTLKYHGLCFPSAFTTVGSETVRTTSGDIMALYRLGHADLYSEYPAPPYGHVSAHPYGHVSDPLHISLTFVLQLVRR